MRLTRGVVKSIVKSTANLYLTGPADGRKLSLIQRGPILSSSDSLGCVHVVNKHKPKKRYTFPGAPLPTSALVAIGAQRSGPWMVGFGTAIVATVLVFSTGFSPVVSDPRVVPLLAGALAGLLVGLGAAWIAGRPMAAGDVHPDQEQELRERAQEVCGRLSRSRGAADWTRHDVDTELCDLVDKLEQPGPQWLDAAGFLDAWCRLHEAEQDLLLVDSREEVIGEALYDLLRVTNSMIPGKDQLDKELRGALPFLSNEAANQLGVSHAKALNEPVARERIRRVRVAINENREEQWAQIVRSRNGLLTAGAVTLGIAYLLVVMAVGFSAAPRPLASALVFALIGALVSATHQLLVRSDDPGDVEDFGFSSVKLAVVPVLSGVVAVLAVVLLTQVQLTLSGQSFGGSFTSWQATFDWRKNPSALLVAIIFGLAPSLFFSLVTSKVNDAMASIKSSQASGAATK
jgi:hypothetical protein